MTEPEKPYGIIARFADADQIVRAIAVLRQHGHRKIETFSPYPIEGVAKELGIKNRSVQIICLAAALFGACGGYYLEYYAAAVSYPLNVGGRPYNGVPAFLQVTFEMLVLSSAFAAFVCVFIYGGLLKLHHPIFEANHFSQVSRDAFFVFIAADDPKFDRNAIITLLEALSPLELSEVPGC